MAKYYPKLSKILQKLLFERRINTSELARQVDLPIPTVHRLVTGKSTRPYPSSLKPIADYFSLEIAQLTGDMPIQNWGSTDNSSNLAEQHAKIIPIIAWEDLDNICEAREKSDSIVLSIHTNSNCFALTMNDHSMEPLFPKKTILLFDPGKPLVDRGYVLVKLSGNYTPVFRQILIDIDHRYIKPLNLDFKEQMRLLHQNDIIIASLFESRINHLEMSEQIKNEKKD